MAGELTHKQEKAVVALLECPTLTGAARAAGMSETTLWRWLREESFRERYRSAARDAMGQAVTRIQRTCGVAIETLETLMTDPAIGPAVRVSAARAILDGALKATDLIDLHERVEALERLVEETAPVSQNTSGR